MKYAKKSFSKEPYVCQKPWPEDCFCQCGGDGVVFTDGSLQKTLEEPKEQTEAIKAVLGQPTNKKHYRTAFFEAFPKNPSCFIRGEGASVEEAEAAAFKKFEKILNCKSHKFDRRNRTDGYAYCTLCPLSGTFLEPLTKCKICQVPSSKHTDNQNNYYCLNHYFELEVDSVVDEKEYFLGFSKEESVFHFLEDKKLFQIISSNEKIDEKSWEKYWNHMIHIRAHIVAHYNPLFGKPSKTKAEIHNLIMQEMENFAHQIINHKKNQ